MPTNKKLHSLIKFSNFAQFFQEARTVSSGTLKAIG